MSDRPSAINGKRNQAWGTMAECPACGQCLCFGCHPDGPCVDDRETAAPVAASFEVGQFATPSSSAWLSASAPLPGASGLRMRSGFGRADDRLA
jgi:hypothetical protein